MCPGYSDSADPRLPDALVRFSVCRMRGLLRGDFGCRIVTASDDKTARVTIVTSKPPAGPQDDTLDAWFGAKWDWREKLWYIGPEGTRAGLGMPDPASSSVILSTNNGLVESARFRPDGTRIVTAWLTKALFAKGLCLRGIPKLSAPFKRPIFGA